MQNHIHHINPESQQENLSFVNRFLQTLPCLSHSVIELVEAKFGEQKVVFPDSKVVITDQFLSGAHVANI